MLFATPFVHPHLRRRRMGRLVLAPFLGAFPFSNIANMNKRNLEHTVSPFVQAVDLFGNVENAYNIATPSVSFRFFHSFFA